MVLDITPSLHPILDGLTVTGGGRTQTFRFIPWGRHWSRDRWSAIQSITTGAGSEVDTVFTIREVANPTQEANTGGNASKNFPVRDLIFWWQDGADISDPDAWRNAVVQAVKAVIHANRQNISPATFVRVVNSVNVDALFGGGDGDALKHEQVVTVRGECHEVY